MKKWLLVALLILLALTGYVAAGPYMALHGISKAVQQRDAATLSRYVDFPSLRVNLKAQLSDHMVRRAGPEMQSSLFGAAALGVASSLAGAGVDTLVTPVGIGALMQGQGLWKRAIGDTVGGDTYAPPAPAEPLREARHRYESSSRFTATTYTDEGQPLVFVLSRQGLRWKLSNIILPLQPTPGSRLRRSCAPLRCCCRRGMPAANHPSPPSTACGAWEPRSRSAPSGSCGCDSRGCHPACRASIA